MIRNLPLGSIGLLTVVPFAALAGRAAFQRAWRELALFSLPVIAVAATIAGVFAWTFLSLVIGLGFLYGNSRTSSRLSPGAGQTSSGRR